MPPVLYADISYYSRGIVHIIFKEDARETLCKRKFNRAYSIRTKVWRKEHLCKSCKRRMKRMYPDWRYYGL